MIIAAVLVLATLIAPASGTVSGVAASDADTARQVGQSFIAQRTAHFPEWEGALLTGVQTFHDLDGSVNAYLFGIEADGKTVGRIVVGGSEYNHDVLEAGTAPVPEIPTSSEVAQSVEKDLAIAVTAEQVGAPKLVYLGYDSYVALYKLGEDSVAFDLRYRKAALAADMESHMTAPEEYRTEASGGKSALLFQYVNLPVPLRGQVGIGYENNCGPTSGAMIAEYYKDYRGKTGFWAWQADHNRLYETMYTNSVPWPNGTLPWNAGPGFVWYAAERGYSFGTYYHGAYSWDNGTIKNCIDVQQPNMIMFWAGAPYATWHYCAITGYWIDDYGWYLIVNNPGSTTGYSDLVNWSANWPYVALHFLYPS